MFCVYIYVVGRGLPGGSYCAGFAVAVSCCEAVAGDLGHCEAWGRPFSHWRFGGCGRLLGGGVWSHLFL